MKMKFGSAGHFLVAFVLVLAIACGGGGGGGGGGGANAGGNAGGNGGGGGSNTSLGAATAFPGFYLEFQDGSGVPVDPLNLRPGTTVKVQAAGYDSLGNKTTLSTTGVSVNGGAGVVVDANRNMTGSAATGFFQVSGNVTIAGVPRTLTQECRYTTQTAVVQGNVRTLTGSRAVKFLQVDVYDTNGNRIGSALCSGTGAFKIYTTTAARKFNLNNTSLDQINANNSLNQFRLYKILRYSSTYFNTGDVSCAADLPSFNGATATLPANAIVLEVSSGPPPPPTGCAE